MKFKGVSKNDRKKYTEDHEWISLVNDIATIGISKHAVDELGEIVFVELPEIDTEFESKDEFGSIESVNCTIIISPSFRQGCRYQ